MNLSVGLPIEVTVAEDMSKATFSTETWLGITASTFKARDSDNRPVVHTGTCIMFKNGHKVTVTEKYDDLRDKWMVAWGAGS